MSLFRSAHDALTFAFNYSAQQYERPLMNRLADSPSAVVSKGLSGMDGAGQAGLIFCALERLKPLHQFIVFATYAPRELPCSCRYPCCSGKKRNELWEECIRAIEEAAVTGALAGCVTTRTLRRGLIKRAFGDKSVSMAELAEQAEVSVNTATNHYNRIKQWLYGRKAELKSEAQPGEKTSALIAIDALLTENGVVGSDVS